MENYQIFDLFWKSHLLAPYIILPCWEGKKECEVSMPEILLWTQRECQDIHALQAACNTQLSMFD